MKSIAILGSSGGNLFNLGGKEPQKLLGEIISQAESAGIRVDSIQFIGANSSMDNISSKTRARIYSFDSELKEIAFTDDDTLIRVNEESKSYDLLIAKRIREGYIDGLVLMSSDPKNTNSEAIKAAIERKITLVGTGGTSMATIQSMGGKVIAVSGTTGTTNRTRAISAIQSLSNEWDLKYRPQIGSSETTDDNDGVLRDRISFRGIMMSALPGFIAMAIILALSKIPALSGLSEIFNLLVGGLPIIVAAIAAKQVSGLEEVGIVAGVVTGLLSVDGGLIGGLIGGILAGVLANYIIRLAFKFNFPGTTANIVSGGLSGLIAGIIVYYFIAPISLAFGEGVRSLLEAAVNFNPILAGGLAGLLIWPAIIGGVYHAAILPIVLLEMEKTGASFLGAIDMTSLVMVSAGITLANILYPKEDSGKAMAVPGFFINMVFGTFVEASYPFMFSDKLIFGGAIISGGIAGMLVGLFDVRGTAYVPSFTAPALSNNPIGFVIAMVAGLGTAFLFTVIANKKSRDIKMEAK